MRVLIILILLTGCAKFEGYDPSTAMFRWILTSEKIIKYMLEKIYHYSGSINSWSWSKLYKNRKDGYGYEDKN